MPKPHYYFLEDEHYNYFYDMYCLDYVHQDMMEVIIGSIKSKYFPDAELQRLKEGLEKLKHTEAYEDYGVPYVLGMHKNYKLIKVHNYVHYYKRFNPKNMGKRTNY